MKAIDQFAARLEWHLGPWGKAVRDEIVGGTGEYVGTTMFLFIAFTGTHIANLPGAKPVIANAAGADAPFVDTSNLLFIACAFGFGLAINAWIFFRVSGAVFNPAITLSLLCIGALSPLRSAIYFFAQILGGITAAALTDVLMPGGVNFNTSLSGGINTAQGLFLEMFMTAQLVMVVLMLGVEKAKVTYIAPLAVGLTLFMAEIGSVYYTGGSLNPARSFGPNVVMRSFPSYHWIYWVGPFSGSLVATGLYVLLKAFGYENVNGTADRDDTTLMAQIVSNGTGVKTSSVTSPVEEKNGYLSPGTAGPVKISIQNMGSAPPTPMNENGPTVV